MSTLGTWSDWASEVLSGLPLNLLMAGTAMAIGTLLGGLLAFGRNSSRAMARAACQVLGRIALASPTMVLQFYLAVMLPPDWGIPPWLKASLALSVAVMGFCADQFEASMVHWRAGRRAEAWVMLPSWTQYGLIILLATSTASLIGVPEMVSRCQRLTQTPQGADAALSLYAFAIAIFWAISAPFLWLTAQLTKILNS
jgi:polar amino acid transport system permease protein